MSIFLMILFIVTILAMAGAAIMQVFRPDITAKKTGFGLASGWQREIGFWNVAMIVILVGTLFWGDKNTITIVSCGAIVLGVLLGSNHLKEYLSTHKSINLIGAIENYILVALLIIALLLEKR